MPVVVGFCLARSTPGPISALQGVRSFRGMSLSQCTTQRPASASRPRQCRLPRMPKRLFHLALTVISFMSLRRHHQRQRRRQPQRPRRRQPKHQPQRPHQRHHQRQRRHQPQRPRRRQPQHQPQRPRQRQHQRPQEGVRRPLVIRICRMYMESGSI